MQEKERVVFVDYVRVVAPLLVMLVHASENFYAADASGLAGNVSCLANEDEIADFSVKVLDPLVILGMLVISACD